MTVPLIGLGLGLDLVDLAEFIVEPAIPEGVHAAQRDLGADLTLHEQGLYCVLQWAVIDGMDDLDALLAQLGWATSTPTRTAITAYLPDWRQQFHRYQGYAIPPLSISYALWPADLRCVLNQLTRLD